jgi:hypothetical protein
MFSTRHMHSAAEIQDHINEINRSGDTVVIAGKRQLRAMQAGAVFTGVIVGVVLAAVFSRK